MKKVFFILLLSSLLLTGCGRELVREENIVDSVVISEIKYKPSSTYTTFSKVGSVMVPMTHTSPASYTVIFDYKGTKIQYKGKSIYNQFKNKLNNSIECEMNMKVYDDNSFDIEIINFIGDETNV